MLPAILAVGAIAAVVLLLIGIFGRTPAPGTGDTSGSPTTTAQTTTAPPATTTTTTPPPTTTTPVETVQVPEIPDTPVVVLNSTGESGLASRVTDYLAELGWSTGSPDNFAARLDETTVYYPEGQEAVAALLAAAAPGDANTIAPVIPEVDPDVFTVVLGTDAVGWVAPEDSTAPPP